MAANFWNQYTANSPEMQVENEKNKNKKTENEKNSGEIVVKFLEKAVKRGEGKNLDNVTNLY